MTLEEFNNLEVGDSVKYGPFSALEFGGVVRHAATGNDHVVMNDGIGGTKKVYKELFIKHGHLVTPTLRSE